MPGCRMLDAPQAERGSSLSSLRNAGIDLNLDGMDGRPAGQGRRLREPAVGRPGVQYPGRLPSSPGLGGISGLPTLM